MLGYDTHVYCSIAANTPNKNMKYTEYYEYIRMIHKKEQNCTHK